MNHYIVVLPDKREFFYDADPTQRWFNVKDLAEKAIREAGLKTACYGQPETIYVNIFRIVLEKGKAIRKVVNNQLPIELPFARMSQEQFNMRQAELLRALPEEFHGFVNSQAWERGHSAGLEEVMMIMEELTDALEKPIFNYTKRIQMETRTRS